MSAAVEIAPEKVDRRFARRGAPRRGGHPQKWVLSDEARTLIVDEYDSTNRRALAKRLGVPPYVISKWAGELGVRPTKEPPWSEQDVEYLRKNVARMGWQRLAKKLGRTVVAVKLKAKRLEISKMNDGGWTARQLGDLLGVDSHRVRLWIDRGWLRATRRQTDRTERDAFLLRPEDLRTFLRDHANVVNLRRVDPGWLFSLAFGEPEWRGDIITCRFCTDAFTSRSETPPTVCASCAAREAARRSP